MQIIDQLLKLWVRWINHVVLHKRTPGGTSWNRCLVTQHIHSPFNDDSNNHHSSAFIGAVVVSWKSTKKVGHHRAVTWSVLRVVVAKEHIGHTTKPFVLNAVDTRLQKLTGEYCSGQWKRIPLGACPGQLEWTTIS